jgi:hypothetical protein
MTITYGNLPALGGSKNADIPTFTLADFSQVADTSDSGGNVTSTTYRLESGDPTDRTFVVIRRAYDPSGDYTRVSVRVITNVEDDSLDEVEVGDYEAIIAWNHPGNEPLDVDQQIRLLASTAALVLGTFDGSTGEPAGDTVTALAFGRTAIFG